MCDLETAIYVPLLEELSRAPMHRYSYASELLEVSQRLGRKYGLYDEACFQTSITKAEWDSDKLL
ncbi:MAG: hypothetical protein ACK5MR_15120 [Cumulibacter sp.]